MVTATLLWALWIDAGGYVNAGALSQPYVAAYFTSLDDCERVNKIVREGRQTRSSAKWSRCIQANYVIKQN